MSKIAISIVSIVFGTMLSLSVFYIAAAHGEGAATPVAVVAPVPEQAPAPVAASAAPAAGPVHFPEAVDPIEHPAQAASTAWDVKREMGVLAALVFVLMTVIVALKKRAKAGSFLDRGRVPLILGAAISILGALGGAVVHEITWTAAFSTALTALAMIWNPAPTREDVAGA